MKSTKSGKKKNDMIHMYQHLRVKSWKKPLNLNFFRYLHAEKMNHFTFFSVAIYLMFDKMLEAYGSTRGYWSVILIVVDKILARKFYLRRNSNISAQADTDEHRVRCTVTSLIFE